MADESVVQTKICTKCGEAKPETAEFFYRQSAKAGGKLNGSCKVCFNAASRARYDAKSPTSGARRAHLAEIRERGERVCRKCGETKPWTLAAFTPSRPNTPGSICRACDAKRRKQNYLANPEREADSRRQWRDKNAAKAKQHSREWYLARQGEVKARVKAWYEANRERAAQRGRQYRVQYSEKISARDKQYRKANWELMKPKIAKRMRERRAADPVFALVCRMRHAVWMALNDVGESKRRRSWTKLVGYTREELCAHIERQFLKGMSWKNIGKWHVDHIVPLSSFKFTSAEDLEFRAAWSLTNLRPLWAKDNIRKSDKRILLL